MIRIALGMIAILIPQLALGFGANRPSKPPTPFHFSDIQEIYWAKNFELHKNFVRLGCQQGESLPAESRKNGETLRWADTGLIQGWYLSALAYEFAIARKLGNDTTDVETEIKLALKAVDRLDVTAEYWIRKLNGRVEEPGARDRNGFFIRDDVPASIIEKFSGIQKMQSDFEDARAHASGGGSTSIFDESQDQLTHLFWGFRHLQAFVQVAAIQAQVKELTARLFNWTSRHDNWTIDNPVTGEPVARGASAFLSAGGLESVARQIIGSKFADKLQVPFTVIVSRMMGKFMLSNMLLVDQQPDFNRAMIAANATGGGWWYPYSLPGLLWKYQISYRSKEIYSITYRNLNREAEEDSNLNSLLRTARKALPQANSNARDGTLFKQHRFVYEDRGYNDDPTQTGFLEYPSLDYLSYAGALGFYLLSHGQIPTEELSAFTPPEHLKAERRRQLEKAAHCFE